MSLAVPNSPTPPRLEVSPGRRIALVVGVNGQSVPGRDALKYAVDDAREMAQVLHECCGFELFRSPLLGEQASTENVREAVLDLADMLEDHDMVLFYFSGHGEPMTVPGNVDDIYLVTQDFNPAHIRRDPHAHLSMRWLRSVLYELEQDVDMLLILECCYAGNVGLAAPDLYRDELLRRLAYYFDSPSGTSEASKRGLRITLSATAPGAVAHERDGHGVMTKFMLPALRGDYEQAFDPNKHDCITFTSLYSFLESQMPGEQQPRFFGAGGPLVLATYPGRVEYLQHERQRRERIQNVRAMIVDHSAFLRDRLASFQGRAKELVEERAAEQEQGLDGVAFHFIPLNPGRDHQFGLLRNLMARLILKYDLPDLYVDGQSTAALRDYFPGVLKEIAKKRGQEIIFIDGLDQLEDEFGTGLQGKRDLSFLPNDVPPGVVFVLGTRPNDTLRPLQLLKPRDEYELPNLSRDDFDLILQHHGAVLEPHIADQFYRVLDENALFLDLAATELTEHGPITTAEVEAIIKLVTENPENLFGLAIERLSQRGISWEQVIKPILGVLLVAREPLDRYHLKQIINLNHAQPVDGGQISEGLERLGGLVIRDGQQRYTLSHLKLGEYLREDASRPYKRFVFDAEDVQYLHQWLVRWCAHGGITEIWGDVQGDVVEQERRNYARQHYIDHLYHAQAWTSLFGVLDEGSYGKAKVQYDLSTRAYALDLDWGRQAAASARWGLEEGIRHLAYLWRYTLLRCSLASRADQYPEEAFQLMLRLGEEAKAIGFAELITMPEQKAVMLLVIARYLARQAGREADGTRMFLRVQEVISFISDERQRARILTALATALAQAGQQEQAQRVWVEAERVTASIPDEWHRARTLTALATALAQAQQWAEAERISTSISDEGEQVKAVAALATALAQAGQQEQAQQVLAEAERMSTSISDEWQRPEVLTALATALAQLGRQEEAQQVLAEVERLAASTSHVGLKVFALKTLATALVQQQQWAEAERVAASNTEEWQRANTLSELAIALAQAGRQEEAQRVWAEVERVTASFPSRMYEMLGARILIAQATALAQAGRQEQAQWVWAEAEQVTASFPDKWEGARKLTALATALAQAGRQEEAQRVWAEAERVAASISEWRQKALVLKELAFYLAWQQQWAEAERVGTSLTNKRDKAEALTALAIDLARHQQWTEARRVSASIPDEWLKAEALIALAAALAQAGQQEEAQRVWAEAEQVSTSISDAERRAEVLRSLAAALAQAGQQEEAQRVLAEAERVAVSTLDMRLRAAALWALAIALAQQQQWAEAERVSASISDGWRRAEALIALATALAQAGQQEQAQRVWAEAEQVAVSILDTQLKADALRALAIALAQQQQWAEAERVSASISHEGQRAEALIALATALAQAGQQEEAQRVLAEAERVSTSIPPHGGRRAEALTALVIALAQQQQWAEAERVSTSISEEERRAGALTALAAILAANGEFERLLRLVHGLWQRVERLSEAVNYLPLAYGFLPRYPGLGTAFSDAFTWVDTFLRG